MNFYFESIKNDLDISRLDCEIEIDRANLTLEYYSNMENFYKESYTDEDEFFMESGNKIKNAIKKAFEKAIETISKCIEKIQEIITGKRIKKLEKDYNEALKKDPSLKNKKIEYKDYSDIIKEREESAKKLKKYKGNDIKKEIEKENERISKMKPKVANIAIGSAFALLLSTGGVMIKKYNDKIKDLKTQLNDVKEQARIDKDDIGKYWRNTVKKNAEMKVKEYKQNELRDVATVYGNLANDMYNDINEYRKNNRENMNIYKEEKGILWALDWITCDVRDATRSSSNLSEFANSILTSINRAFYFGTVSKTELKSMTNFRNDNK